MENFLSLMNSISDSWMSPSSMDIAMDMGIAFVCGAGLFFLLLPFLKDCPVSPPPERERDIPKDVKRLQSKTKKKTDTAKGDRRCRKYVEETQTPSQPMKIPTKQLLQDSTPQPMWNPLQNMDHLPPFQLVSYLKALEGLIQKELSQIFWGTFSMFSESVVATAHVLRTPSLAKHKTVKLLDACGPEQGQPQHSQDLPLPLELVTPSLLCATGVQELENLPSSTPNQTPSCFKSRACRIACPTTERGTQTSLQTANQPWQHGLNWKTSNCCDIQKHQAAISKPTGNLSRGNLHNKPVRLVSILPEHCQMVHNNEEPQSEDNTTNVEEHQGTPGRFLPSRKLTQLQGHFPANSDHYCKSRPQHSEPAQPSILNSKSCNCSKMMESVPSGLPSKKDIATCDRYNSTKKGLGLKGRNLPYPSCHSPGKGMKPMNSALRTDKLFHMNPDEHDSCLDSNTDRKLKSNIRELPVKRRRRPYLQILEAIDLTPPGVPASDLPQIVYPSSPICDSKAEYYSKAAMVLENLHHQDPGGTRVESISDAGLESAVSIHSLSEVQESQRTPPPAASRRASEAHPGPWQRFFSVQQPALCSQLKPPQSRTMYETGTDSLQTSSSPKMTKHASQKRFTDVDSEQSCWRVIVIDPEERVPPSPAKQSDIVEVKEEPPPAWTVSLGSSDIHNDQVISMDPRNFGSLEANKIPGHLQTCTPQHSQDSGLKPQAYSKVDLISKEQPEAWLVKHDPDGPSTVHPAKVSLPSQHSWPSSQNTHQNPQTSQGLNDVSMRSYEGLETKDISMPKDKIKVKDLKELHPHEERHHEERQSIRQSSGISWGENLGTEMSSIPSSTHLKDTAKTWIPENAEATSERSWNALQYEDFSTKYLGQGDSLQNDCPPSTAEQIQKIVTRNKFIYNIVAEIQSLVNILVQSLENPEGEPSKVQECEVESLMSQLGDSSLSSEGLYDTNHSRATSKLSCGHVSPEMHNCPFAYRRIGDEPQSGIENQGAYDLHLNQGKREMGFDQLPMPKGYDLTCRYRGRGNKQEPGLADQRACDLRRTKIRMGHCAHGSPGGHKHSIRYKEIGDKHPGVDHKAFDPHRNRKKSIGCGLFLSPRENHPVKHRGTDCSWASVPAQPDSDPR